ncbi:G-protein coupled receptor 39-like [Gadus chalcogrammus]|uniref:G-protein coupled receptor 39-like n=1 Tax=Gadus chalcogrammus TaxID=1042646 RepID=UPI0024C4950B|nr:G-protein coupled receptor 39-like [Gadus chalcogrammus]
MNIEPEVAEEKNWRDLEASYSVKVFLTILYVLILVTGIVGNAVTIRVTQVLLQNGYLHKNVTDHMVSLACSDLLVLIIGMPVELYSAIWFPFSSTSGNVNCKMYNFLFEACSYATILNVATMSFERYMAICHPFRFKKLAGKHTSTLIAFAWLTSVLVALPMLFTTGTQGHIPSARSVPDQNVTFCTNLRERWVMYQVSISGAFVVYMVVLSGVAVMCWAMVLVLRGPMGSAAGGVNGSTEASPKHESSRVKTARKQTIIFLGLIVGALTVCWMPNQVRRLMGAALPKASWTRAYFQSYVTLQPVADTFFYLSSVLNPLLYNLSSRQFREVFVQVLRCRLRIEHVNKRTVRTAAPAAEASTRSRRPLLSLPRSGRKERSTGAPGKTRDGPLRFLIFKTNSGSAHASAAKDTVPTETEI